MNKPLDQSERIENAIKRQINSNATKNVLYREIFRLINVDPEFVAMLEDLLESKSTLDELELERLAAEATQMIVRHVFSINQFIQVDEGSIRRLQNIYRQSWKRIVETRDIQRTLMDYHYPMLARWVALLYPKSFVKRLRLAPKIGQVVCEEYSARIQLGILNIDPKNLKEPILDIGCGARASLVRYLRYLGFQAFGFDRQIEKEEEFLRRASWFDFGYEPRKYGAILSHMALSNHVAYAYHNDRVQLPAYLAKCREILDSLIPGGSFTFAPSAPYLEGSIDLDSFSLETWKGLTGITSTRITRLEGT